MSEAQASTQRQLSAELQPAGDLRLDAAERRVVSMFVGAGMVSVGGVARLRARRERVLPWQADREVG